MLSSIIYLVFLVIGLIFSSRLKSQIGPIANILITSFTAYFFAIVFFDFGIKQDPFLVDSLVLLIGATYFVVFAGVYKSISVQILSILFSKRHLEMEILSVKGTLKIEDQIVNRYISMAKSGYIDYSPTKISLTFKGRLVGTLYTSLKKIVFGSR